MGYNTSFELTYDAPAGVDVDGDTLVSDGYEYTVADLLNDEAQGVKWYDHENDMIALSRLYPTVLFALTGTGEEPHDQWRTWYRSGKSVSVEAEIVYVRPDLDDVIPIDPSLDKEARRKELAVAEDDLRRAQDVVKSLRSLAATLRTK